MTAAIIAMRTRFLKTYPPSGDYIVNPTGLTWGVNRSNGDGTGMNVSNGVLTRESAVAALLLLAEGDQTDAWETVGTGSFWLIKRYRNAS